MAITFDKVFGVHQHTMRIRNQRAEVIAGNLANADTPGFKARDIDFNEALVQAAHVPTKPTTEMQMQTTAQGHMTMADIEAMQEPNLILKYRNPFQPDTGNGNTVEASSERMKYMSNNIEYQATMQFLNGKISTLRRSLSGQ